MLTRNLSCFRTDTLFFKPHTAGYQTDFPPTSTVARFDPGKRDLILTYLGSMQPCDTPEGFIVKTSFDPDPKSTENGEAGRV